MILDRYILRTVFGGVALALSVLVALGTLFTFIQQQDDIGVGAYRALDAMFYTVLGIPQQVFLMLPIAALIGALLGLGALARGSELTVMRASGLSIARVALSAALAGLVLMLLAAGIGEYLAPPMQQFARQMKAFSKFDNVSFAGRGGAWVRDGDLLLNVAGQSGATEFGGMLVFELTRDHGLAAMGRATRARAMPDGQWQLEDYAESRFSGDYVSGRNASTRMLPSGIGGGFLGLAISDPRDLDLRSLWRVMRGLAGNGLDARTYEFAFWSRVARTVAVVFAVLLAVPFVFGPLRSSGTGARTMIGLIIGIAFFLAQRMLESGAIVFDAPPMLLAWAPTLCLALAAVILIARTR
ncbi:MAG: Lipopolysaccharide export system permease protein LptG [Steroidobacteraceae bacterium]|nr:Lipopolysaccharide export system permease protein LptG [Steroidobacteraceae bacterium]